MHHIRSSKPFLYISLLVFLFSPIGASPAHAATPFGNRSDTDSESALNNSVGSYNPPAVYVTEINLTSSDTSLAGSFTILNQAEDTVGDVRYRYELLEPLEVVGENQLVEDSGRIYDSVLSSDVLALIPEESRTVSFTYNPPKVPAGSYRFRIQLTTSQGRDLGWNDTEVTLAGSADTFIDLTPGTILLPEFSDEVILPMSGPNVSPSSTFTLRAFAKNTSSIPITITPTLSIYDFATSGKIISSSPSSNITLNPEEGMDLEIPVTAPATPGVYHVVVTLKNGDVVVSPLAQYRFVVRGSSAHIISARIKELQTKASEKIHVALEYAGPADAETTIKALVFIDIVDSKGVAGSLQIPETIELTDAIGGGIAQVPLTRDLDGTPGLRITLKGEDGTILDTYEVAMPLSEDQKNNLLKAKTAEEQDVKNPKKTVAFYLFIVSLLLTLLVIVLGLHKKKNNSAIPLGLLLVIATAFTAVHGVLAAGNGNGIEVVTPTTYQNRYPGTWTAAFGNRPVVEIFINKPRHNAPVGTYNKGSIPFEYRMQYGVCGNYLPKSRIIARYDKNGGKLSSLVGSPSSDWQQIFSTSFRAHDCSGYYCLVRNTGSATLNLSRLQKDALNTTLQVGAFWNHIEELYGVPQELEKNNWHIKEHHAHVVNIWMNFKDPATVPPKKATPTPTSPTPTPTDPPNGANRPPVAIAKMSIDNGKTYGSKITVPQNESVNVRLTAAGYGSNGSYDPDGWDEDRYGVAKGGKCQWNLDLSLGQPTTYETTKANPQFPSSCDMDLGTKKFAKLGTYTYPLLRITDASGAVSNSGSVQLTVVADPNPNANDAPVAIAKMSIDNGKTYSSKITVTQNESVNVRLTAGEHGSNGSYDPDGWDTLLRGVSKGGKIEWNSDLDRGIPLIGIYPTYNTVISNPALPISGDINLGLKKFPQAPGTYTYTLLKITDASGAVSNAGTVTVTVISGPTRTSPTPTPTTRPTIPPPASPTPTPTTTPVPTVEPGDFEETR